MCLIYVSVFGADGVILLVTRGPYKCGVILIDLVERRVSRRARGAVGGEGLLPSDRQHYVYVVAPSALWGNVAEGVILPVEDPLAVHRPGSGPEALNKERDVRECYVNLTIFCWGFAPGQLAISSSKRANLLRMLLGLDLSAMTAPQFLQRRLACACD